MIYSSYALLWFEIGEQTLYSLYHTLHTHNQRLRIQHASQNSDKFFLIYLCMVIFFYLWLYVCFLVCLHCSFSPITSKPTFFWEEPHIMFCSGSSYIWAIFDQTLQQIKNISTFKFWIIQNMNKSFLEKWLKLVQICSVVQIDRRIVWYVWTTKDFFKLTLLDTVYPKTDIFTRKLKIFLLIKISV